MTQITLPRVAGYRGLATALVEKAGVSDEEQVVIDGRGLVASTESFAAQIAKELSDLHVRLVTVLGGSPEWQKDITVAGSDVGLTVEVKALNSL